MDETFWYTHPFDDDDDDFGFESGNAELASEIREYSDDEDDEFDASERASVTILTPVAARPRSMPAPTPAPPVAPVPPVPAVAAPIAAPQAATKIAPPRKAVAAKKTDAKKK